MASVLFSTTHLSLTSLAPRRDSSMAGGDAMLEHRGACRQLCMRARRRVCRRQVNHQEQGVEGGQRSRYAAGYC